MKDKTGISIKKKEIESFCKSLAKLVIPFSFYNHKGKLLYASTNNIKEEKTFFIKLGETIVGEVRGERERIEDVGEVLSYFVKILFEKKSLTTHTLNKYRELNFLSEMSEILSSSLDIDKILCSVTLKIKQIMGVENCSIMTIEGKELFLRTVSGKLVNKRWWLNQYKGVAGKAIVSGKPVIVNEPIKDPDFVNGGKLEIKTLMCMPLKVKDKSVGVLNLSNKLNGIFTSEDESLLISVSVMIAGAIETSRLLEEKLKQERFATIGQMAAGIIHDIKNPMATIKGFAGLLGDMDFSQQERKQYSKMIVEEVDRLVGMIEDLLLIARGSKRKLSLKKVILTDFFQSIIPMIEKDLSSRGIKLLTKFHYNGHLYIDIDRFKRVIFNIVGNAKEAMHEGGNFLILTKKINSEEVEIIFADSGKGIPEDILPNIFEPFVTKGKKSGTGLGLAIVKRIIEEHGGSITALNGNYSGINGFSGANFILKLSLVHEEKE